MTESSVAPGIYVVDNLQKLLWHPEKEVLNLLHWCQEKELAYENVGKCSIFGTMLVWSNDTLILHHKKSELLALSVKNSKSLSFAQSKISVLFHESIKEK